MIASHERQGRPWTQWGLSLLLSVSLALAFFFTLVTTTRSYRFRSLSEMVNAALRLREHSIVGYHVVLLISVALSAVLLSLVQNRFLQKPPILWLSAAMVMTAPPASWIIISQFQWYGEIPFTHVRGAFLLDIGICVICSLLYVFRRWPVPLPVTILLVAIHFAYWTKRFAVDYFLNPLAPAVPLSGFVAIVAWTYFVRSLNRVAEGNSHIADSEQVRPTGPG